MKRGDHLVVRGRGYTHHGIYMGDGTVVHYQGRPFSRKAPTCVARTTVAQFAKGRPVTIAPRDESVPADVVCVRAESRIGEDRYNVATNNCEHFARWACEGEKKSPQVRTVGLVGSLAVVLTVAFWLGRR